jgi:uncharacterized protein
VSVAIAGARVLLTGATGGLGQAIARELAARGARLVLSGRRVELLDPLAEEVGGEALATDLADRGAVEALAARACECDALVANAALPGSGRVDEYAVDEVDRVLDVNLRAPILLARAMAPVLAERGRGQLVFMSSLSGKAASPRSALYSATKFGLRGFALALREDLHGTGVGVSTIFPGFVRDAGLFHDSGAALPRGVGTRSPQDVARAVARALERDPAELDVAPLSLRAGAALAGLAPRASAAVARRLGSGEIAAELAAGQTAKR